MTLKSEDLFFVTFDDDKTARVWGVSSCATTVSEDDTLRAIKFPKTETYFGSRYKITDLNTVFFLDGLEI